jgi:hypothetical protein
MADSELNRLRAEVVRMRRAVTNKIYRTKKNTGANLAGTNFDPRQPAGAHRNMSAFAAREYLAEMQGIMGRSVQFVAGAKGAPLPRAKAAEFNALQNDVNAISYDHEKAIGSLPTANPDETVAEFRAKGAKTSQGGKGLGPYKHYEFKSSDIASAGALDIMIEDMRKKTSGSYLKSSLDQGRSNAMEALKQMGELSFMERLHGLSDFQFDVLWYGSRFAEITFGRYESEKKRQQANAKEQAEDRAADEQFLAIGDFFNWVEADIPKDRPTPPTIQGKTNGRNRR